MHVFGVKNRENEKLKKQCLSNSKLDKCIYKSQVVFVYTFM